MKTFLERWQLALAQILRQEISARIEITDADGDPSPAARSLAVSADGERLIVAADVAALHAILMEAGLVGPETDSERDHELWRGLVERAAAAASGSSEKPDVGDAKWNVGGQFSTSELRLGEARMRLGFALDREPTATASVSSGDAMASQRDRLPSRQEDRPGVDLLLDVELEASLRFGSCEMFLNEVLELGPGDVVELDRHVADPVDLLVGDKIVARGEVVLVNGNFGLRIQEVAEPKQCLESVRCLF